MCPALLLHALWPRRRHRIDVRADAEPLQHLADEPLERRSVAKPPIVPIPSRALHGPGLFRRRVARRRGCTESEEQRQHESTDLTNTHRPLLRLVAGRSEERRVGKEGKSWVAR